MLVQLQQEGIKQRRENRLRLFAERRDMLWAAEREQLLKEKIQSEQKWFNSPAGSVAQKKLEQVHT